MANTISEGLKGINEADFSKLLGSLAEVRVAAEKALKTAGKAPTAVATPADIAAAASRAGLTVDQFLELLSRYQRVS